MVARKIVRIDEEKCDGCGLCLPACPEGAIEIVDGKARLVSDIYCDGLGACLGECPQDAITIEVREAEEFSEEAVKIHLEEMEAHQSPPMPEFSGCPGSRMMQWDKKPEVQQPAEMTPPPESELRQWPVQLMLLNPQAEYFENADVTIAADCVPFAYANFHQDFLKGRSIAIGCPKLDDLGFYQEKLTEIFRLNSIKSVTVLIMEVPCCFGLVHAVQEAIAAAGKGIPFNHVIIGIRGEKNPAPAF